MLTHGQRPRELRWYHAGPMLFGDWGTSRLYVLGLAFFYVQHASLWFMSAMSLLLIAVGWAYGIICRTHPDGGGVYSSARHRSQSLAVVGALLLCADYLVTAAISSLDAFHYLNLPRPSLWAAASIGLIAIVNYFGPRKAGTLALIVAVLTVGLTLVIALAAVPSLGAAHVAAPAGGPARWWTQFTALILAISGVEAIANMTGIMVAPVARTSRRSIWPVVLEIAAFNIILTIAMQALPLDVLGDGEPARAFTAHRDDMLRVLAAHYIGPGFAAAASLAFAFLLLSAANTAVTDLVSIQFMLSRDRELPVACTALNAWGMPVVPLVLATLASVGIVLLVPDVGRLADLYAIGVVGAVAINLGTCSTNSELPLGRWERLGMQALAVFMSAVWVTIAWEKPHALAFAAGITVTGLATRFAVHHRRRVAGWLMLLVRGPILGPETPAAAAAPAPGAAALAPAAAGAPPAILRRILVPTRGNPKLLRFAFEQAESRQTEVLLLFVRHLAVPMPGWSPARGDPDDVEAKQLFEAARAEATARHLTLHCLYAVSHDIADTILDFAATYGVETVILGATQRGALWHVMKGDVIQQVARYLPEDINLLIHA